MAVSPNNDALPKRKRINCSNCGYRVPADALACPHCRADPRQWRVKWSNALLLFVGALLFIYIGALVVRIFTFAMTPIAKPEPTSTSTPTVRVALASDETATLTPITLPPTLPASATPTITSRFSPTPTRRGAPTSTPTLESPTPKFADYAAPRLTAPLNDAKFTGADTNIILEWQSVSFGGLRENEWYQIAVSYTSRNGALTQTVWSRETRLSVKKEWWSDAMPNARTFTWNIQVMRIEGADPYASLNRIPASPPSELLKFMWQ